MKLARLTAFRQFVFATLIVLPVLVMSAFPQGTMAIRGAQGIEVVLCTGDGPLTIRVDENGTPVEDQYVDAADCGWWLLGQGLILSASPGVSSSTPADLQVLAPLERLHLPPSRLSAIHPARAPPVV